MKDSMTYLEAYDNLVSTTHSWRFIDMPPSRDFSGRFLLRLPKALHERVSQLAEDDGVSLNTFLVALIAERVGLRG